METAGNSGVQQLVIQGCHAGVCTVGVGCKHVNCGTARDIADGTFNIQQLKALQIQGNTQTTGRWPLTSAIYNGSVDARPSKKCGRWGLPRNRVMPNPSTTSRPEQPIDAPATLSLQRCRSAARQTVVPGASTCSALQTGAPGGCSGVLTPPAGCTAPECSSYSNRVCFRNLAGSSIAYCVHAHTLQAKVACAHAFFAAFAVHCAASRHAKLCEWTVGHKWILAHDDMTHGT